MRRRRPDLLCLLFEPIETDRRGEVPPGGKPYFTIPTYNWHAGLLSAIYQRQYIESARRFAAAPPPSEAQREAFFAPLLADTSTWFDRRRGSALGLLSRGTTPPAPSAPRSFSILE